MLYTEYGKKMGFSPLRGREADFEKISEELHRVSFSIKNAVFAGTDEDVKVLKKEKEVVLSKLSEVSKVKRTRSK